MSLRWGIVSAGKICHDFVNAFNSYPHVGDQVIAAVAAGDQARAEQFAKTHGIGKVFASYNDMAKSKDVDVVYIGALNPDHYNLSKLFLESGKHVLCEKPLCLNYKQSESLIKIAKSKGLFLMEAVWSRFAPSYIALEKEIAAGNLGDVQFVEVNFGVPIISVPRLGTKNMGGSAVLDIGIYTLQFAQYIFKDEPITVTARGELNEDGVDIVDTVILEYAGGRRAVLNINATIKLWNKATVVGTKGRATVEDPFHFPEVLIKADGSEQRFPLHNLKIPSNFENSAGLVYEALEVARCIKEDLTESPRMSHRDSLVLAKLMDTVRKQVGVKFDVDDKEFP
ncbi:trans-1,2-dihydrobenzene-1,2-diol dehydrogenase-like [Aricia agestis]|uniref:trans-1,2-dihydrobenzene-1,2-diol dehydrogenase-like n=1 Tax=Aricia agestis TaxID=91739 RepID=UPI001C203540|nr:trans-1,2-dihydrobenzene-1,2-diol dehydrogenase-like [Aricia agestis]XP_041975482.1 trans-1,2-dihydrobenzene-1,2-diol dehydrogenase-like [Aricia agestis]